MRERDDGDDVAAIRSFNDKIESSLLQLFDAHASHNIQQVFMVRIVAQYLQAARH